MWQYPAKEGTVTENRIAVVTDSTAHIPAAALGAFDIPVIPLWLIWGEERFRDNVDIDPHTFYARLPESTVFPTTSQPSAGEFERFFRKVASDADAIVGVFISSRLSGTVASALAAQAALPDLPIRVVDSLSTSMGLGFGVLAAARAAADGKSLEQVVTAAERVRDCAHVLFAVDTLEYLHRGGRIGGAKRFLGTALNIKPLLQLEDGCIEPLAQIRTKRKAVQQLLQVAEDRLGGGQMGEASVLDVAAPEEGDALADEVASRFGLPTVFRTTVSPVIGAHAGPGTVGLCFYPAHADS
jgi:DegV family protein with EDD domain